MKKLLIVFMCMLFAIGTLNVSAAEADKNNMEKVLVLVKERIGSTDEYPVFSGRSETNDQKTFYRFSWSSDDNSDEYKSLDVYVSESGIITSYHKYYSGLYENSAKPSINKISNEEAFEKAKELAKALNPSIADKLILKNDYKSENIYNDGFEFNIQRYENNIPVKDSTGYISIDSKAENIISYNISYDEDVKFETPGNVISKEKAIEEYKNKLGLSLEYINNYKDREIEINPVYIQKYPYGKYINAYSGEVTESKQDVIVYRNSAKGGMISEEKAVNDDLTIAEIGELDKISGLKSKDELVSIVKNNKYIKPKSEEKLIAYSAYKVGKEDKYNANLRFANETRDIDSFSYYELNARTGEIISYSSFNVSDDKIKTKVSSDKALKYADEAVKYLAGEKLEEYREDSEENGEYYKNYIRYVNGIPYRNDSVYISINEKTGKPDNYRISYSDKKFPEINDVISADEAADKMFENVDYELTYLVDENNSELIYNLKNTETIKVDPFSGKLLDYNNDELKNNIITEYTDIDNHYAKEQIKTLAKHGICFEDPLFRPDEFIKEKDFIALLVCSSCGRSPEFIGDEKKYDEFYNIAYNQKIINKGESERESEITRETAAKYIIRALDIEEYAKLEDIFNCPFNDVSQNKGYVSLLYGMKIIGGNGSGKFNPGNNLKRADAAIMMYNYLSR